MSKLFTISEGLENMGAVKVGGQGSVYKGRRIGEIITAIKLLPTPILSQDDDDKHYHDFINEVQKLKRVGEDPNPNIVKILSYGVSETGSFPFIEMEFIDGPDLGELLKPPHPSIFTIKEIIKVADQLSNALAHCHKLDVKHGDIKSNNVKYNQHTGNYVLIDFGLAILSDEERRSSLRHAGAIEFMAPEQNEGRMYFETDVYSFGIILYELLAGKVPFPLDGNSETARNKVMVAHMEAPLPDALFLRQSFLPAEWTAEQRNLEMQVPEWIIFLLNKCLEKDPKNRFRNGVELYNYISHHRVHTAEVIGLVKDEDAKWRTIITSKEAELEAKEEELRTVKNALQKREKEVMVLQAARPQTVTATTSNQRKVVSRSAFTAVLIVALLAGAFAIYSLFISRSTVSAAETDNLLKAQDSIAAKQNVGEKHSENTSTAKKLTTKERKKHTADSIAAVKRKEKAQQQPDNQNDANQSVTKDEKATDDNSTNDENNAEGVRYKVRNVAYFHDEPDESTRRRAFINHWNNAILKPLREKNGFVYIIYTNDEGQTSKGWLSKDDLVQLR